MKNSSCEWSKIKVDNKLFEVEPNNGKVKKDNNADKKVAEGIEAMETSEGVEGVELKQHLKTGKFYLFKVTVNE